MHIQNTIKAIFLAHSLPSVLHKISCNGTQKVQHHKVHNWTLSSSKNFNETFMKQYIT